MPLNKWDNISAGRPLLSQHPKPLTTSRSSSGFSHLWPGVFHISLQTHNIHNREDGRKEKKLGLRLAPSARREKFPTLSEHSVLLQVISSVYFFNRRLPSTSVDCSLLLTAFFCSLPSSVHCLLFEDLAFPRLIPFSWEISHASSFCGFRAKIDKGILWRAFTPTPTETNAQHRSSQKTKPNLYKWIKFRA